MSAEMAKGTGFDPSRYLTKVGSADYLEVKHRLVWLRDQHPDAIIDTEGLVVTDQLAVFKATVTIPSGGSATGHGSETPQDFRDHIEKSETKAIGRALAALGYGTQFCPDFDFGSGQGRVVDAPIDFSSTRGRRLNEPSGELNVAQLATPRQHKFIQAIGRESGWSDDELNTESENLYGVAVTSLTKRDASAFIERLQERQNATKGGGGFSDGAGRPDMVPATPDQPAVAETAPEMTPAQRTAEYRKAQNARYHAVCQAIGMNEHATRVFALAHFADRDSRRQLTGQELHDLADEAETLPRLADGSVNPAVEFANRIGDAADEKTLSDVATQMTTAGVLLDWLVKMGMARRRELRSGKK